MQIDETAEGLMPKNWELWMSGSKYQAMRKGATPNSKNAWGQLRRDRNTAIQDAFRLSK